MSYIFKKNDAFHFSLWFLIKKLVRFTSCQMKRINNPCKQKKIEKELFTHQKIFYQSFKKK